MQHLKWELVHLSYQKICLRTDFGLVYGDINASETSESAVTYPEFT